MKKSKLILASLLSITMVGTLASCEQGGKDPENPSGPVEHIHNLSKVEALAATCTEDGHIEYYTCDGVDCANSYFDAEGNELAYRDIVVPAHHTLTKHDAVEGLLAGSDEYYSCSGCSKFFADADGMIELEENEWVNQGYAIRFIKGERMTTKVINPVKLNELEGKAVTFDLKMGEDGTESFYLNSTTANTWNVSGEIRITKSGDNYRINKGEVVPCTKEGKEGWITVIIDKAQFDGDGLDKAEPAEDPVIDCMVGPWDGSEEAKDEQHPWGQSAFAVMDVTVDPRSFAVVDPNGIKGVHVYSGDQINSSIQRHITVAELTSKAIEMDFKFVTDGEFSFTLCAGDWANMTGTVVLAKSGDNVTTSLGRVYKKDNNNDFYTLHINFFEFAGDGLGRGEDIYVFYAPAAATGELYVCYNDVRIADPIYPKYEKDVVMGALRFPSINLKDVIEKGLAFDFKMEADGTNRVYLFDINSPTWANVSGSLTITKSGETITANRGTISECTTKEGWSTLTLAASDLFNGDGFEHAYVDKVSAIAGDWNGAAGSSYAAEADMYFDPSTVRVVDSSVRKVYAQYEFGRFVAITKAELEGHALSFNCYMPGTEDGLSFLMFRDRNGSNGINDGPCMIDALSIVRTSGVLSVTQRDNSKITAADYAFTELGGGWYNVVINSGNLIFGAATTMVTCCNAGADAVGYLQYSGIDNSSVKIVEALAHDHTIVHHDAKAVSFAENGNTEYWECSICKKAFSDAQGTQEITDGSHIIPCPGSYIGAGELSQRPNSNISLESLKGKAIEFDFLPTADGQIKFQFLDFDAGWAWINALQIVITKSGDSVTTNKGRVTYNQGGYYTFTMNAFDFDGGGLGTAVNVHMYGSSEVAFYMDKNFRVVDSFLAPTPAESWVSVGKVYTKEETLGKAIELKAYFPTDDNAQIKLAWYWGVWGDQDGNQQLFGDIYIRQTNGVISLDQGGTPLEYKVSTKVDGWVTVTFNTSSVNYYGGSAFNIIYNWGGADTTAGCGVDNSTFKLIDPIDVVSPAQKWLNFSTSKTDLEGKALSLNFYAPKSGTGRINLSFFDGEWGPVLLANLLILHPDDTTFQVYQGNNQLVYRISELGDGWYNLVVNAAEFTYSDGDKCTFVYDWAKEDGANHLEDSGVSINSFKIVNAIVVE